MDSELNSIITGICGRIEERSEEKHICMILKKQLEKELIVSKSRAFKKV